MQHIILDKTTGEIVKIPGTDNLAINASRKDLSAIEAYAFYDEEKHIHARGPKPLPELWKNDNGIIREKTLQEKIDDGDITLDVGFIVDGDKIRPMDDTEKLTAGMITQSEYDEIKWNEIRAKRDGILRSTDWTQVDDSPVDKRLWKDYRKALRDLPHDFTDWNAVVWPVEPE